MCPKGASMISYLPLEAVVLDSKGLLSCLTSTTTPLSFFPDTSVTLPVKISIG